MALQLGDTAPNFSAETPVNWKRGKDVIIVPAVSDDDARKPYPQGFKTLKPYVRTVAQPDV